MASCGGEKDAPQMQHKHCQTCIRSLCTVTEEEQGACRMVSCELSCGWRCHQCKMTEHAQLCPEERIPCTNSVNGCPMHLLRKKMAVHLQYCPASVVTCPIEWNRWPMHSQEKGIRISLPPTSYAFQCKQLDVGLAMRDQRMLMESLRAPRRTKRVLRNSLTMRYPAAPISHRSTSTESDILNSEGTSQTASDDETDTPWDLARLPPGLQKSICSHLYSASKQATDSLSAALEVVSSHLGSSDPPLPEKAQPLRKEDIICKYCKNKKTGKNSHGEACLQEGVCAGVLTHVPENCMDRDWLKGSEENAGKTSNGSAFEPGTDSLTESCPHTSNGDVAEEEGGKKGHKLCEFLGVDINIECITRYQAKPPAMYTFLCAQEFRRDEYPWHFTNVHSDIQCGLNGWMEQRCPLAHMGCQFTMRRFHPCQKGTSLIHSPLQESFGLTYSSPTSCHDDPDTLEETPDNLDRELVEGRGENMVIETGYKWDSPVTLTRGGSSKNASVPSAQEEGCDHISKLPFEILQGLACYLDSFSLRNLALVSRLMREVCCSLLEERGIVSLVWEHALRQGKSSWEVVAKRWRFSSSFSPVRQWVMADRNPISEHLKTCPFNQDRVLAMAPFSIIPAVNDPMDQALRRLLAERQRESVTNILNILCKLTQELEDS